MSPHVSIVIVNYKQWADTLTCIRSILKQNYSNYAIIVVDSASQDESVQHIQAFINENKLPSSPIRNSWRQTITSKSVCSIIKLIPLAKNLGFAFANNAGINEAKKYGSTYFWLLNNDTEVHPEALASLVSQAEGRQTTGLVGSVLLEYPTNQLIVQAVGGRYQFWSGKTTTVHAGKQLSQIDNAAMASYPIGASVLVRSAFINEVGDMETKYFLYFEELDWVTRGKRLGWDFSIALNSLVWHKGGGTVQKQSAMQDFFGLRSKLLFTKTYFPYYLPSIYAFTMLQVLNRIKRRQWQRARIMLLIMLWPKIPIERIFLYASVR